MIWEYQITTITQQQSLTHEVLDGRPQKKVLSSYNTFILFLLLAILFICFPNLKESFFLLSKNIITVIVILVLLLLVVQNLHWPSKSKGSINSILGSCKISARDGWFVKESTYTNGAVHQFFMPFRSLVHAIGIDNGILLEFSGHRYCFIHSCAFSDVSLEESLAFFKKEQALCIDIPKTDVSLFPPFLESPFVSDISEMSVSYTLSEDQIKPLFSEGQRVLPRHLSYWKAFRKLYLYFALYFTLSLFLRSWSLAAFGAILFLAAVTYLFCAPSLKKTLQPLSLFCGSYRIDLCIEGLTIYTSYSSSYQPYGQFFDVYRLNSCLCLLYTPQSFQVIPKTAFSSKEEENHFYQTVKNKIRKANKG